MPGERHGRRNRQLSAREQHRAPIAPDTRAGLHQHAQLSLPVSPARDANSLDDVDCYLAEEDEKEDEEAEGAVRPAGETAAGVKLKDIIPGQIPSSEKREHFQ